jgi:hypothetical protein
MTSNIYANVGENKKIKVCLDIDNAELICYLSNKAKNQINPL